MCRSRWARGEGEHQRGVLFVPPYFVYGEYDKVEVILKKYGLSNRGEHETKYTSFGDVVVGVERKFWQKSLEAVGGWSNIKTTWRVDLMHRCQPILR